MAILTPLLVAVTGATGAVGRACLRALRARGHRARALVRSSAAAERRPPDGEVALVDVLEPASLPAALAGVDVVVHAAGSLTDTEYARTVLAVGTRNVCCAAAQAGVRRLVLVSSTAVYPPVAFSAIDEDAPPGPVGPYAQGKLEAERWARRALLDEVTVIRSVTVYGPAPCAFLATLREVIGRGRVPFLGDIDPAIDLVHADDLATALVAAAEGLGAGETFHVTGPAPAPYSELVRVAAANLGCAIDLVRIAPPDRAPGPGEASAAEFPGALVQACAVPRTVSDRRARTHLGYAPVRDWRIDLPAHLRGE